MYTKEYDGEDWCIYSPDGEFLAYVRLEMYADKLLEHLNAPCAECSIEENLNG